MCLYIKTGSGATSSRRERTIRSSWYWKVKLANCASSAEDEDAWHRIYESRSRCFRPFLLVWSPREPGSPRDPREPQEAPGSSREPQEAPGSPRQPQPQGAPSSPSWRYVWYFCIFEWHIFQCHFFEKCFFNNFLMKSNDNYVCQQRKWITQRCTATSLIPMGR